MNNKSMIEKLFPFVLSTTSKKPHLFRFFFVGIGLGLGVRLGLGMRLGLRGGLGRGVGFTLTFQCQSGIT